jgi:hypothetical protein
MRIGMEALHQHLVLGLDLGRPGILVEAERLEGLEHRARPPRLRRLGRGARAVEPGRPHDAERIEIVELLRARGPVAAPASAIDGHVPGRPMPDDASFWYCCTSSSDMPEK